MPIQMECVYYEYKTRSEPHNSKCYTEMTLARTMVWKQNNKQLWETPIFEELGDDVSLYAFVSLQWNFKKWDSLSEKHVFLLLNNESDVELTNPTFLLHGFMMSDISTILLLQLLCLLLGTKLVIHVQGNIVVGAHNHRSVGNAIIISFVLLSTHV